MDQNFERPITDDLFTGIEQEIADLFEQKGHDFAMHLEDGAYTFEALLSDAFDLVACYAVGCLLMEKATTKNCSVTTDFGQSLAIEGRTTGVVVGVCPTVTVQVETNNGEIEVLQE